VKATLPSQFSATSYGESRTIINTLKARALQALTLRSRLWRRVSKVRPRSRLRPSNVHGKLYLVCLFVVKGHRALTYHSITKIYKQ